MSTLSITMTGHNEAHLLPRALESAGWADELIYVDCESRDNSLEVARRYTSKVFSRPNTINFNVNKAFGIEQATSEWVLYLDPDEELPQALISEIRALINTQPEENGFQMARRNIFFGTWLRHGGQYPDWQLRLFRRGQASCPCRHVHEKLELTGKQGSLREAMLHHTCESPMAAIRKMDWYSTFNARLMVSAGLRPSLLLAVRYTLLKPNSRFWRRYLLKGGWRDGWPGLIVASIDSIDMAFRYYKFWYLAQHPEQLNAPERMELKE